MRADAQDGYVRKVLASDLLDLTVSEAETDEFGEGARLAGRREPIKTVALPADDQALQSEHGVFGRTDGGRGGLRRTHFEKDGGTFTPR